MGGKSPDIPDAAYAGSQAAADVARQQIALAQRLVNQTDPLRQNIIGQLTGLVGGPQQQTTTSYNPGTTYNPGMTGGGNTPYYPIENNPNLANKIGWQRPGGQVGQVGQPGMPGTQTTTTMSGGNGLLFQPVTTQNVESSPIFGALKSGVERQYQQARQNTMETTPGRLSGALFDNLGDIESARAGTLAQGMGAIAEGEAGRRERLLNLATGIATGQPALALGGLGSAGGLMNQMAGQQMSLAQSQAEMQAGKAGGLGRGIGQIGASLILK